MISRKLLLFAVAGLLIIGAGCKSSTSLKVNNTNTTVALNTSVTTNTSTTTGSFDTTSDASQSSTVTISSSGLTPSTLTVTTGTVVKFVNNDTVGHQIASNPHPAHTDLPGFDSLNHIQPSASYTYTFNQTGTFGYHDHLDPFSAKWQGQVVVQ